MKNIVDLISEHIFFQGLDPKYLELIGGCGKNVQLKKGEYLFKEGTPADAFYLIRSGELAIQLGAPGKGAHIIETLGDKEVVGWSWIFPPYKWTYDSRCLSNVRLISLDGVCLRKKCESDHDLGFELMKRFSNTFVDRLKSMRIQLLDLYGDKRD